MKRLLRLFLILALAVTILPISAASAQTTPTITCEVIAAQLGLTAYSNATDPNPNPLNGAEYCILVPPNWGVNGTKDAVFVDHGYVPKNLLDPTAQPRIPWDQYIRSDGQGNTLNLPAIITGLGYAFATTSYRKDGLAVLEGVQDTVDLANYFPIPTGVTPDHIYLTGVSEGSLVTTLAIEQNSDLFSAGLATCGPIADFRGQIDYWFDFRVVFDYYYHDLLLTPQPPLSPSTAIFIPNNMMQAWVMSPSTLKNAIAAAVLANPLKTNQLLSVTKAPIDPLNAKATIPLTVNGIFDYNILATNEGRIELALNAGESPINITSTNIQGNPYTNVNKRYSGSLNDSALNRGVKRYQADPAAVTALQQYETSGRPTAPLVVMHTTGDPIVPFWHATKYVKKAAAQNNQSKVTLIPVLRYGHCAFTQTEAVVAFYTMILKATARELSASQLAPVLPDQKSWDDFKHLLGK